MLSDQAPVARTLTAIVNVAPWHASATVAGIVTLRARVRAFLLGIVTAFPFELRIRFDTDHHFGQRSELRTGLTARHRDPDWDPNVRQILEFRGLDLEVPPVVIDIATVEQ